MARKRHTPTWYVQRTLQEHPQGQPRWDQAYRRLIEWSTPGRTTRLPEVPDALPGSRQAKAGHPERDRAGSARQAAPADPPPVHTIQEVPDEDA